MDQEWLEIKNNLYVKTKIVPAGTTLLTQAPLVSVPFRSEQLGRCNYCLQKAYLQCCSKCHAAYFSARKGLLVPRLVEEIRGLDPARTELVELVS